MMSEPAPEQRPPTTEVQVATSEVHSERDWRAAGEALKALRPDLDVDLFVSRRQELSSKGYRLVAVQVGDEMVSMASFTISPHAMHGQELLVHDMATKAECKGRGYGSRALELLENIAKAEGCFRVFVHTKNAAGFYERNGYEPYSTGLIKRING